MSNDTEFVPGPAPAGESVVEQHFRSVLRECRTERRQLRRRYERLGLRRDRMRRRHARPLVEFRTLPIELEILLLPSPADRITALGRPTIDADWIAELVDLIAAPGKVRPASMPMLVQQLGRLTSWAQATQTEWLARFARPGVAVPVGDVLEAAMASDSDLTIPFSHPVQPSDDDLYTERSYARTSVYGDPAWDIVVARSSARFAAVEIGATLHLSPITARDLVEDAVELVDQLPATLEAWRHGRLDRGRVRIIADRTAVLDANTRNAVEHSLLGSETKDPAILTPARLRREVDRTVIATDPTAAGSRAEKAHAERKIQVTPLGDDMSRFSADVPAPTAALANEVLDVAAKSLPTSARAGRTLDQLRADVFADIVDGLSRNGFVDLRGASDHPGGDTDCGTSDAGHRQSDDHTGCSASDAGHRQSDDHAGCATSDAEHRQSDDPDPADGETPAPPLPPTGQWKPLGTSVSVTIAASTLAGVDDDPALLTGYGWITADLARAIATSARSARLLIQRDTDCAGAHHSDRPPPGSAGPPDGSAEPIDTNRPRGRADTKRSPDPLGAGAADVSPPSAEESDPTNHRWCGTAIDYGRSVYRPPAALRDLVIQRDRTCRHPGCEAAARRCDLDHRKPFREDPSDPAGGVTCPCNLDCLCRFHHRAKTFTGWSAIRLPGNRLQWTSPLGTRFVDEPEPLPMGTTFTIQSAVPDDDPAPF